MNNFQQNSDKILPQTPEPPLICDPSIALDENERLILAKGPKFMVREELSKSQFNL